MGIDGADFEKRLPGLAIEQLSPFSVARGFKTDRQLWHRERKTATQSIVLQKSRDGRSFFIKCGCLLHELPPPPEQSGRFVRHIGFQLDLVLHRLTYLGFDRHVGEPGSLEQTHEAIADRHDRKIARMLELIDEVALPMLDAVSDVPSARQYYAQNSRKLPLTCTVAEWE